VAFIYFTKEAYDIAKRISPLLQSQQLRKIILLIYCITIYLELSVVLFPTKALAWDQNRFRYLSNKWISILSYTFDGDITVSHKVRKAGQIVLTNPDMLHSGILPHHTKWVSLFENLKYIVVDELHTYKGVFGSHVAHVLRRLKRICHYYGSNPIFICTSATIANPKQLAESLTNEHHKLIDKNGAPSGKKNFIFYNPPIVHPTFGVRRSAVLEVRDLAKRLYVENIQTIIFAKSRVRVEMLVTYLKELTKRKFKMTRFKDIGEGICPLKEE
jgi:DEAD/DEAH box helicase domain-containing protein